MGIIKNYTELAISRNRAVVLDLIEEAFSSIQPQKVLSENFVLNGNVLKIKDNTIDLNKYERIFLIGFGKGCSEISKIIEETLGQNLTRGFVIDTAKESFKKIDFTLGTHPLPSKQNIEFTQKTIDSLSGLTEKDLVLVVICGGGSVMFESPFRISLDKLIEVNKSLLHSGADIYEMNTLRKHLSKTKGGGLAKLLSPAKIISLIFSDVPGNDLSFIASGPTVMDNTDVNRALAIYKKYNMQTLNLSEEDFTETPKEEKLFEKVENILMLSNLTALKAMEKKARQMDIKTRVFSDKFQSDAELTGEALIEKTPPHSMLLVGGETTVHVTNPEGKGGRNQVVVLSSLYELDENTIIASFDSDGWDNSDVAGALGDIHTLEKAKKLGLNPQDFLRQNNSLLFFRNVQDAIITGRLASNVSDLIIVYRK